MPSPIRQAVTALLTVGERLYMVRRQPHLAAFPGYHAFPGGKIESEDMHGPLPNGFAPELPRTHVRALLRELHEELGLAPAGLIQSGARLRAIGRAVTPPTVPLRFDTHFVHVDLDAEPAIQLDLNEAASGEWRTASEWLALWHSGAALMTPPTRTCLERLVSGDDEVFNFAPGAEAVMPMLESLSGLRQILVRSSTLPPAEHTNCFRLGDDDAPRLLIDPAPRTPDEMDHLIRTVDEIGVDEILITHHHIDHRERANRLAAHFGVPLSMSEETRQRIERATPGFFDDCAVRVLDDGEEVTRWKTQPVRVIAVPGHDAGQLALMPDNRAWCIVGDLIQGIGTVVIKWPEGNMRQYYESMQRVIDLAPAAIFPSHGIGMGTTFRIEETLRHRYAREAQVLALRAQGLDVDAMVERIYADVDTRLWPLARMNIESHLEKLREEGRIR